MCASQGRERFPAATEDAQKVSLNYTELVPNMGL